MAVGGDDILAKARALDNGVTAPFDKPLLLKGVPLLLIRQGDLEQRLTTMGALVFNDVEVVMQGDGNVARHPRDDAFPLVAESLATNNVHGSGQVASALAALAAGGASVAVVNAPSSLSSAVLARQCASWAGVTTYEQAKGSVGEGVMYGASSLADIQTMNNIVTATTITSAQRQHTATSNNQKPLEAMKIAYLCERPLYNLDQVCEETVSKSIAVAADVFKTKLGATISRLKATKGPDGRLRLNMDALEDFDLLLSAAYSVAPGVDEDAELSQNALTDSVSADLLLGREVLCMPCGLVATEDDGYGEVNDQTEREGLPISMLLTALKQPATAADNTNTENSAVVRAGLAFEGITRWSSDLFAPGRSRVYVKEDMDDARESFGIYFVDSLIKYIGKKV